MLSQKTINLLPARKEEPEAPAAPVKESLSRKNRDKQAYRRFYRLDGAAELGGSRTDCQRRGPYEKG